MDRRHIWTEPIAKRTPKPAGWEPRHTVLHGALGKGQDILQGWEPPQFTPPKTPWLLPPSPPWQMPQSVMRPPSPLPTLELPPVPTFGMAEPDQTEESPIQILSGPNADNPAIAAAAQAAQGRLTFPTENDPPDQPDVLISSGDRPQVTASLPMASSATAGAATDDPHTFLNLQAPAIDVSQGRDAVLKGWAPVLRSVEAGGGPSARSLAAIILAENGAGQAGQLAPVDNNWFSIGHVDGRPFQSGAGTGGRFAHYDSPLASVADFVDLIKNSPRYQEAWALRNAPTEQFIKALADAGYIVPEPGFPVDTWLKNTSAGAATFDSVVGPAPAPPTDRHQMIPDADYAFPVAGYTGQVQNHWGEVLGGTDLFAPRGTPVLAVRGGKVIEAGFNQVGGNAVLIQGNDGNQYYYAHFDQAPLVKTGQVVVAGVQIGAVGDSGNAHAAGPHLHLGIGPTIQSGADKYGGTGGDFDAVSLLRGILQRRVGQGQSVRNLTNGQTLSGSVERAQTPEARAQGLLGRANAGGGMLLEGTSQVHMRGMKIPLDIAYFDQKGKVLAVHTLQPGDVGPEVPGAAHVVELPAGTVDQTDTQPGDRLGMGQDSEYGAFDPYGYGPQPVEQPWGEGPPAPEPIVIPVFKPNGEPAEPMVIPVEHPSDRGWAGGISDRVQGAAQQAGDVVRGATQGLSDAAGGAATEVQRRLNQSPSANAEEAAGPAGQAFVDKLTQGAQETWNSMQESAKSGAENPTIMGGGSGIPDFGIAGQVANVFPQAFSAGVNVLTGGQHLTSPAGEPMGVGDIAGNFVDPIPGGGAAIAGLGLFSSEGAQAARAAKALEQRLLASTDPGIAKNAAMYAATLPTPDIPLPKVLESTRRVLVNALFDTRVHTAELEKTLKDAAGTLWNNVEMAFTVKSRLASSPATQVKTQELRQVLLDGRDIQPLVIDKLTHLNNLDIAAAKGNDAADEVFQRTTPKSYEEMGLQREQSRERMLQVHQDKAAAQGNQVAEAMYSHQVAESQQLQQQLRQTVARQMTNQDYLRWQQAQSASANVFQTRKFPGGVTAPESRAALAAQHRDFPTEMPRVEAVVDHLRSFIDGYRQEMRDAGVWSQELFDDLTTRYPNYIPTKILEYMDKEGSRSGGGVAIGKSLSLSDRGLRALTEEGTSAARENPLASILRFSYDADARIMQNKTFNAFHEARQAAVTNETLGTMWGGPYRQVVDPIAGLLRIEPDGYTLKRGEATVTGFVDGVKTRYITTPSIANAVEMSPTQALGGAPARFLTGAVRELITRWPTFIVGQFPLDYVTAVARIAADEGTPLAIPRIMGQLAKNYVQVFDGIAQGEFRGPFKEYLQHGGGMAGLYGQSEKAYAQSLDAMTRKNMLEFRNAKDFVDTMKWMATGGWAEAVGRRQDLAPRATAMQFALRRGESMDQATMHGRDVTLDFQRGGWLTKSINGIVPFFNVGFQGAAVPARMLRDNPRGAAASLAITAGIPTITAEIWNRSDPERSKDYDDVPDYIKKRGIVFMLPKWAPGATGTDAIGNPRPRYALLSVRELAPFVMLARQAAEQAMGGAHSPSWGDLAKDMGVAFSPIQANGPGDFVTGFLPPGIGTAVSLAANQDFFRDQHIQSRFADLQASPISRGVADFLTEHGLKTAPSQAEFAIRDLGGGFASAILGASNALPGGPPSKNDLRSTPVAGGLINRFAGDAIGGELQRTAGTGGILDKGTLALFSKVGADLQNPPYDLTYSGIQGASIPLTQLERKAFQAAEGKIIQAQMTENRVDPANPDVATLQKIATEARSLATDSLLATMAPADLKRRIQLETPPGEHGSITARKNAADLLVDINDKSKHPDFLQPDGKTPFSTPSQWAEMRAFMAVEASKPAAQQDPKYPKLVYMKKLADASRLGAAWDDPRFDDYERYVVGQLGSGMNTQQWNDYQSGKYPKYTVGSGPADWREMDRTVKMYRTLPAGNPAKEQLKLRAQKILSVATPDWRNMLDFDELTGRRETGELAALDAQVLRGAQP